MPLLAPPRSGPRQWLRLAAPLALALAVAACGGRTPEGPVAHSGGYHQTRSATPPGPAHDPWGPWIAEASDRFDVPQVWIREVMRVESGGRAAATSPVGAMGLMQVMPGTYAELRDRYALGDDPYHPYDNIMAGTAYLREMYDRFASPGFLAAYNGGPRRFEDYLWRRGRMPDETRNYVAKIAPRIAGVSPRQPAPAQLYAAAYIPHSVPPGQRRGGNAPPPPVMLAQASSLPRNPAPPRPAEPLLVAAAPVVPNRIVAQPLAAPASQRVAPLEPPVTRSAPQRAPNAPITLASAPSEPVRFRLISPASAASSAPAAGRRGGWSVQVGAFATEAQARYAAETARRDAGALLADAGFQAHRVTTRQGSLVRARLEGLSRDTALAACERIEQAGRVCIAVSPDA